MTTSNIPAMSTISRGSTTLRAPVTLVAAGPGRAAGALRSILTVLFLSAVLLLSAILLLSAALPPGAASQEIPGIAARPTRPHAPDIALAVRGGRGPAATLEMALSGTVSPTSGLRLGVEAARLFQGIESCEQEFPDSYRCSARPLQLLVGASVLRPSGSWLLRGDAAVGAHRVSEDFGGTSPLLRLGGGVERELSADWVLQVDAAWSRAFNATWRHRLGAPPVYRMMGVGIRRRLGS